MQAADWQQPAKHRSLVMSQAPGRVVLRRALDSDEYFATICWREPASFAAGIDHQFVLSPSRQNPRLEFVAAFSPGNVEKSVLDARASFSASEKHWNHFWTEGGAIELAGSRDPRAPELERRIVLSQYLTAIQCAGSKPPQETGLTVNSWYGKFHLEMHWWHAAHFALWNRIYMLAAKNRFLPNGHNWQRENLPCYLPGNGGLLYAVAMMTAGWQGAPNQHAPGFPSDGSWTVRWENLSPAI